MRPFPLLVQSLRQYSETGWHGWRAGQPSLLEPCRGRSQILVGGQRLFFKLIERRVIKDHPPLSSRNLVGGLRDFPCACLAFCFRYSCCDRCFLESIGIGHARYFVLRRERAPCCQKRCAQQRERAQQHAFHHSCRHADLTLRRRCRPREHAGDVRACPRYVHSW